MKSALLLNDDRYFSPDALDRFLSSTRYPISKIYIFPGFLDPRKKQQYERASMRIMGPVFVARYLLRVGVRVITEPFFFVANTSIAKVARRHGISCQKFLSVDGEDFLEDLQKERIEIGLSMVSQIYKEKVFELENFRLFNFHPSLLPRNKGKFPIFWAFLRQEAEQGVTCHRITPKIDEGEIVFQKYFELTADEDVPSVLKKFVSKMPDYMEEALERIHQGRYQKLEGDFRPFYGPLPTKRDIESYHKLQKR